ncbi:MAG TPA: hypothetical protein VFV71_10270 [Burkholderiales bacterium]|nr:hypothetical protein [Burkholderiales bacterium]
MAISRDRMRFRHIETRQTMTLDAPRPFTTSRLLIGGFSIAQNMLRRGIRELTGSLGLAPTLVLSAVEMSEGGLSEAEEKLLLELGYGVGARYVAAATGDLSSTQILALLRRQASLSA